MVAYGGLSVDATEWLNEALQSGSFLLVAG